MNGRNKDTFWIWGIVAGTVVFGGAIALYIAMRDEPAMEAEETLAVSAPAASAARTAPANAANAANAATAANTANTANTARNAATSGASAAAPAQRPEPSIPLPPLDASDAEVRSSLNEVVGARATSEYLLPERVIRNVVVTLDNLTRDKASIEQRPIKPIPGKFLTAGSETEPVLAPENYARYEPFMNVVRNTDARTLVSMYRGLQPLFQEAYEELGHPNESFNQRLLEIIEHLLEAPEVEGPIRLVQPGLLYEYADEEIQSLSVGKKLLIRVGPANRAAIKAKLREIRAALV
jgi:hypothetical protein